jgi:hypothetical protein
MQTWRWLRLAQSRAPVPRPRPESACGVESLRGAQVQADQRGKNTSPRSLDGPSNSSFSVMRCAGSPMWPVKCVLSDPIQRLPQVLRGRWEEILSRGGGCPAPLGHLVLSLGSGLISQYIAHCLVSAEEIVEPLSSSPLSIVYLIPKQPPPTEHTSTTPHSPTHPTKHT